jgi:hypothetical protein
MKKFGFIVGALAGIVLAGCNAAVVKTGIGYGLVHGHYVGVSEVTTEDDVITEISFEEYFLPYSWAKVTATEGTAGTVAVRPASRTGAPAPNANPIIYAQFVKIGTRVFTIEVTGAVGSQTFKYTSEGIADIDAWVATEANALWYVERIKANDYGFVSAATGGTALTFEKADGSAKVAMTKTESNYWNVAAPGLGWTGNMAALETLLVGTTMDFTAESFSKDATTSVWGNGTLTSGATLTDFKDYINLALRAYANRVAA